jgi:hypothetical protein
MIDRSFLAGVLTGLALYLLVDAIASLCFGKRRLTPADLVVIDGGKDVAKD